MNQKIIQRGINRTRRLASTHHRIHRHYLLTQKESDENEETKHDMESNNIIGMYARERFLEYMRRSEICAR